MNRFSRLILLFGLSGLLTAGSCFAATIFSVNTGGIFLLRDTNIEAFDVDVQGGTLVDVSDTITGPVGQIAAGENGTSNFLVANLGVTEVGALVLDYNSRIVTPSDITLLASGVPLGPITDPALARATATGPHTLFFTLFSFDAQSGLAIYQLGSWTEGVVVPEPATFGMLALGLTAMGLLRRRLRIRQN